MATTQLKPGDIFNVRIVRLLPVGLVVELENGSQGFIRARELTWEMEELLHWRANFVVKQRLNAMLLDENTIPLEFSLRRVDADPWRTVTQDFPIHHLCTGIVTGTTNYGVFVELVAGVTGLLHKSQLPSWMTQPVDELFWVGDRVNVLINGLDVGRRTISLTLKELAERRWQGYVVDEDGTKRSEHRSAHRVGSPTGTPATPAKSSAIATLAQQTLRSVLVLEDDPAQNEALCQWLSNAGHRVVSALKAEDALALLVHTPCEIVLSDVNLPAMDGIAATRQMKRLYPYLHCVLTTDWATADLRRAELEEMTEQGVRLLLKPLLPEELLTIFLGVRNSKQ